MDNPRQLMIRKVRLKREKAKRESEGSLAAFARHAWDIVEPGRPYVHNWHIDAICEHLEALTRREIRNLIINVPPRHMKGIANSCPILTTNGWSIHGDLKIGDQVFHPSGNPVKVIALSHKFLCDMEVELTNGQKIVVNGDHLWTVYNRSMRQWQTRSTTDLRRLTLWSTNRAIFQLPDVQALQFEPRRQVLPPYFVGAWLGDGTNSKPAITHHIDDEEIIRKIESLGIVRTKLYRSEISQAVRSEFRHQNILQLIRELGLYRNKHIPDAFKFGSIDQRLELMAGLIDTDGHVGNDGRVRIGTSSAKLRDDILDVAVSLGWRPYVSEVESPGYEQYGDAKPHYSIGFNPTHRIPLALQRKTARQNNSHIRRRIGIKTIRPVSRPEIGNCIQVDSRDGLYVVGKKCVPTHNSLLVGVFWPAWIWGPNNSPHEDFLFGSYSPKLSSRDSLNCRRILCDPWYIENWGSNFQHNNEVDPPKSLLRDDQNEKMRYQNIHSGVRIATSLGGTGTGDGGDFIGVDDPHKVKTIESSTMREGVINWWDNEMSTRGNDPLTVCKLIIMQRVHANDLSGHVLEKSEDRWEHLCLPFEYEQPKKKKKKKSSIGFKDPREKDGELLWKVRYDDHAVKDLKGTLNIYQQTGQLQQRPTPKEGSIFKRKWFTKRFDPEDMPKITHILHTWDLTFGKGDPNDKKKDKSAYNVGYVLGLAKPNILVLDEVRKKMELTDQIRELPNLRVRWPGSREILIENAANAKAVVSVLKNKVPGLILVNTKGMSKEDRAEAVTWLFEASNILFPPDDYAYWVEEAIEEIIGFGPMAKFKDRVDSLVHGVTRLATKMKRTTAVPESMSKLSAWNIT